MDRLTVRETLGWIAVAVAARLPGFLYEWRDVDHLGYLRVAADVAAGKAAESEGVGYWPPLLPLLAAALAQFGMLVEVAAAAVVIGAGVVLILPVSRLAGEAGGVRAARWAAAGAALLPALVVAGRRVHPEPLAVAALLGAAATVATRPGVAGALCGLAYLARYEFLLAGPIVVVLAAIRTESRIRPTLLAAGGFLAVAAPWWAVLGSLDAGWPLPWAHVAQNVSEAAALGVGGVGLPGGPAAPWSDQVAHAGRRVWSSLALLPRAVPPPVLILACVGWSRGWCALTLLGVPALLVLPVVDPETRRWLVWSALLLPPAAVALARAWEERPALLDRWAPLFAAGLLLVSAREAADAPLPVLAPGEPSLALAPLVPAGWLIAATWFGAILVLLAAIAMTALRRGEWSHVLAAAASVVAIGSMHAEQIRTALPPCHFAENLPLRGIAGGRRVASARALDAHVLGGVWIPPPTPGREAEWVAALQPELFVLDSEDSAAAPIVAEASRRIKAGEAVVLRDEGHLRVVGAPR